MADKPGWGLIGILGAALIFAGAAIGVSLGYHQRDLEQKRLEDAYPPFITGGFQGAGPEVDYVLMFRSAGGIHIYNGRGEPDFESIDRCFQENTDLRYESKEELKR